jgi:hypothetical protein
VRVVDDTVVDSSGISMLCLLTYFGIILFSLCPESTLSFPIFQKKKLLKIKVIVCSLECITALLKF